MLALLAAGCFSELPDTTSPNGDGVVVTVDMTDALTFTPRTVTIRAGQSVRWRGVGNAVHTVTADPSLARDPANVRLPAGAEPFDSGIIQPGGQFVRTFTVAGRYDYVCLPHETVGMLGTVIVEP
ncbi:MAG TPA: plastocyanin/azurin family copper-binding protein [Longimicrobiaceae bacterium]|nr:plastocyanin/azurin family copper-binding protein [Longimicrobiaceae bacterium]